MKAKTRISIKEVKKFSKLTMMDPADVIEKLTSAFRSILVSSMEQNSIYISVKDSESLKSKLITIRGVDADTAQLIINETID